MAEPKSRIAKILLLLLIAGGAGYYFYDVSGGKKESGPQAVAVRVAPVQREDMPVSVRQVGTVVANQTVAVRSRLDSQIVEVKFKDGDSVKEGDVLFVLDDRMLVAELRQEQAKLANLRTQYERAQSLYAKNYASAADRDAAKAAYEAQKATSDAISTQLDYARITAPISGRTGTINFTVGNTVKANDAQPMVTINQMQPIRVQFSLPQQYLGRVRDAMAAGDVPVTATRDGNPQPTTGTLEYIDNVVDQASGTFAARALFANTDEALWPGMFVTVEIKLGLETGALTLPEVALQRSQTGDYVFVVEDHKAVKREVTLARTQDGKAIIGSGLTAGETVVVDGMLGLTDGTPVTVNAPASAP